MGDLNGLLKALREDVAFAGKKGATVTSIVSGIDDFYKRKSKATGAETTQNVDRAFQERVWSWLTRDPSIFVGHDREGNSFSLSEVEERNKQSDPLLVFTTERQIWIVLTGHEKDSKKVPAMMFELLEAIANCREKGITQPEAAKITGQDKRSVPNRTNNLVKLGHIKKYAVLANHVNTSILVHSRFAEEYENPEEVSGETCNPGIFRGHNRVVQVEKEIRAAIKILEEDESGLLLWMDLKRKIGVSGALVSKLLAQAMRTFEDFGVIARVRASASIASYNKVHNHHRCVKLLRSPTEEDWVALLQYSKSEQKKLIGSTAAASSVSVQEDAEPDDNQEVIGENTSTCEELPVPSWNPDRLMGHTIRDALLEAGTSGLSTKDLKRVVSGPFYVQPVDRFLDRCVWKWYKSQPQHVRHLSIVRDAAQNGKTKFYIHFVHDAFGVKVTNGETLWTAVQPDVDHGEQRKVDQYGFRIPVADEFAGAIGDRTLKQALEPIQNSPEASRWYRGDRTSAENLSTDSASVPVPVPVPEQITNRAMQAAPKNSMEPPPPKVRKQRAKQYERDSQTVIGRPRKYPNLGENLNTTNMSAAEIKKAILSHKRAQEYIRKKAQAEVKERVAKGIDESEAVATVTALYGLTPASYEGNTIEEPHLPPAAVTRPRGRPRKRGREEKISYLPSILAHTMPPLSQSQATAGPLAPKKLRIRAKKKTKLSLEYQPSILAHTQRIVLPRSMSPIVQTQAQSSMALVDDEALPPSQGDAQPVESSNSPKVRQSPLTTPDVVVAPIETSEASIDRSEVAQAESNVSTPDVLQPQAYTTQTPLPPAIARSKEKDKPQTLLRTTHFHGTIAAVRRMIIMSIVENCDGVFPGDGELYYPFLTAYVKKFPDAKPDQKTVKLAKTLLIGEKALKQIFFTCKNPSGIVATKSIIAFPSISDLDPRVKQLQKDMSESHPRPFYPSGADVRADLLPKNSAYDASRATAVRQNRYSNNLPVVDDIVTPHFAWKGKAKERAFQKHSLAAVASQASLAGGTESQQTTGKTHVLLGDTPIAQPIAPQIDNENTAGISTVSKTRRKRTQASLEQNVTDGVTNTGQEEGVVTSHPKQKKRRKSKSIAVQSNNATADQDTVTYTPQSLAPQQHLDNLAHPQISASPEPVARRQEPQPSINANGWTPYTSAISGNFQLGNAFFERERSTTQLEQVCCPNATADSINGAEVPQDGFINYSLSAERFIAAPVVPVKRGRPPMKSAEEGNQDSSHGARKKRKRTDTRESIKKRPRLGHDDDDAERQPKTIRKRLGTTSQISKTSTLEIMKQKAETTPGIRYSTQQESKKVTRPRGPRGNWDPKDDRTLLIACCFNRVVLGGVRQESHWAIISRMLSDKYEREACRRRWAVAKTKFRADIDVINSTLRKALLDAYEKGAIPALSFDNFWNNDWPAILQWAIKQIDDPDVEDFELPATREAFETSFLTKSLPSVKGTDFLEIKRVASVPLRHAIFNTGARVVECISPSSIAESAIAKSFIMANILTPSESYDKDEATMKLQQFPEPIMEEVLQHLLEDKLISQANKGRAMPGRSYDASNNFAKALVRKLTVAHFKYATAFKGILDKKFQEHGMIEYKSAFGDGEVITLINLLESGSVELEGLNIPNKRYGLMEEGYKTRTMDKQIFMFNVNVRPKESYVDGTPIRPLPAIPSSASQYTNKFSADPRIPLWIDIHGKPLPIMWDMAIAAIMSIITVHTCADAAHIAERLQPIIADFEVQLLMEWLVDANVAGWKDERHDVIALKPWWWSVITTPIARSGDNEQSVMIAGEHI